MNGTLSSAAYARPNHEKPAFLYRIARFCGQRFPGVVPRSRNLAAGPRIAPRKRSRQPWRIPLVRLVDIFDDGLMESLQIDRKGFGLRELKLRKASCLRRVGPVSGKGWGSV